MGLEQRQGVVGKAFDRLARVAQNPLQKMLGQQRNVRDPLAQRRQLDVDYVHPVEQILAKASFGHGPAQILVGREDRPHVDGAGLRSADRLELELLQHAEQLDLHSRAGGADLVEEDRPLVGLRELAQFLGDRPGERPGDVAEQLAFEQRLGQRPAGHFDKRLVPPRAGPMDRPGDERLAGPALAGDQHGGLGVGDALDDVVDPQHAVVAADDVLQSEPQVELGLQRFVLFDHLPLVERPLDGQFQLGVDQRLGEKIERPGADRLDGRIDRAVAGDEDHRRARRSLPAMGEHLEAVAVAEPDVAQRHVVGFPFEGRDRLGLAHRRVELIALVAKPVGHRVQHLTIVVDQQQRALGHGSPG